MRNSFKRWMAAVAVVGSAAFAPLAQAQYSNLYVFGDSLSDTGNVFIATGGVFAAPPFYQGRFSNGPVWVDYLALDLGLPLGAAPLLQSMAFPALPPGQNYAFGGARTGAAPAAVPGVLAQVAGLYLAENPMSDPNALFVVAGGGNDMRDAREDFGTLDGAGEAGRQGAAEVAVANLSQSVQALYASGARNVLLANLPDLGGTPEAVRLGLVDASTDATNRFNAELNEQVSLLSGLPGLNLMFLDLNGLAKQLLANAGAFGITNLTEPCEGFIGAIGNFSCDASAFSDDLHPSAKVHGFFGLAAIQVVAPPVPEPQSLLLLATGLLLLGLRARRAV